MRGHVHEQPIVASRWDDTDSVAMGLMGFWFLPDGPHPQIMLHLVRLVTRWYYSYTAFAGALAQLLHVDMDAALSAISSSIRPTLRDRRFCRCWEAGDVLIDLLFRHNIDLFDELSLERIR